jgi:glycosyltransferase involved in cell wall biosynthesis
VPIALDATYSLGQNLSGVGVYSREMLYGITAAHPRDEFLFCYRPHRFLPSYREKLPPNAVRRLLIDTPPGDIFHALNQRLDAKAARTVCTFHDLFVMTGEYSSPEFRDRFTQQARRAAEMSDLIVAVSHFTAGQVRDLLRVPADRIRVVHHGVKIPAPRDTVRENLVLFVGAIQKRKNIGRLVNAFRALGPSWRLVLAGAPDGHAADEELRAAAESNIEVPGYVSAADLDSLYRRAKIFAFPSLVDGFGMPVLEALAHGVPVVTSQGSALPEVAGDAALLVDPFDTAAIAAALVKLADDDALRAHLARLGLERAKQFTWESAVDKTWRVYSELR